MHAKENRFFWVRLLRLHTHGCMHTHVCSVTRISTAYSYRRWEVNIHVHKHISPAIQMRWLERLESVTSVNSFISILYPSPHSIFSTQQPVALPKGENNPYGCHPNDSTPVSETDAMVLRRGKCSFDKKALTASSFGANLTVVVNSDDTLVC